MALKPNQLAVTTQRLDEAERDVDRELRARGYEPGTAVEVDLTPAVRRHREALAGRYRAAGWFVAFRAHARGYPVMILSDDAAALAAAVDGPADAERS